MPGVFFERLADGGGDQRLAFIEMVGRLIESNLTVRILQELTVAFNKPTTTFGLQIMVA